MKSDCKRATRSRRISTARSSRKRSSRWSPTCPGERRCSSAAPGSTSPPGIREPRSPAANSTSSSRTSPSHKGGAVCGAPRRDAGQIVACPERKLRLDRGHGMHAGNALELFHGCLGDAEKPDFARGNEPCHGTPCFFHRDLWIHSMQIVEIDDFDAEALERGVARLADVLGPAVSPEPEGRLVLDDETRLRGDDHLLAPVRKGAANEGLVSERPVNVRRVEMVHAEIDCPADDLDRGRLVYGGVTVAPAESHAAEADRKDRAIRGAETPLARRPVGSGVHQTWTRSAGAR